LADAGASQDGGDGADCVSAPGDDGGDTASSGDDSQVSEPSFSTVPFDAPAQRIVYFDYDQSIVNARDAELLRRHAEYMKQSEGSRLTIEGHCDERGSKSYNLALGERRAVAVRDILQSHGIAGSRLSVVSFGEEVPEAAGSNEAAWAKNRRAVLRHE